MSEAAQDSPRGITSAAGVTTTLIDLVSVGAFFFATPWLGAQLFSPSPANHFILIPGFVLMIAGIVAIRCLPDYSIDEEKDPSIFGVCLAMFLLVSYLLLYTTSTNIGGNQKDNEGYAIVIFFIVIIPYFGAFCVPVTRAKPESRKALVASSIGLISVNYLTLIGTSLWGQFAATPIEGEPVYATGISFLILYTILFGLFLAFFGLPRIYLLRATGDKIGLGLYLAGVAIYLWDKVPPVN